MATSTRAAAYEPVQDETGTSPAAPGARGRRPVPLSLAVILVPASIGLMRLLVGLNRPFAHAGDAAILETAVRRVATGTQALGPYSRFGFHQLGPAYFDVQAPVSWLTGGSPRSLFIGALVVNFGAAAATVAVIRRRVGEPGARWAAVVVAAYLLALTPALVADPWNPYVLGAPLLLTIVLAASAAAGSWPAAAGAVVIATFVVQTHLGAGITLLALFGVASVLAFAGRRRGGADPAPPAPSGVRRRRWARAGLGAAAVLLAVFWIPPVAEQATRSPGNMTLLARFFGTSHPEFDAAVDHGLGTAAGQVAEHLATVPLGRPFEEPAAGGSDGGDRAAVAVTLAGVGAAVAVIGVGWRRRAAWLMSLAAMSLVAAAAAVWSTTRVVGEVLPYLLVWTGALLLPVWIAAGLLFGRHRSDRTRRVLAIAAGGLGAALAWSMLRAPLPPVGHSADVPAVRDMARRWLDERANGEVRVRIGEHDQWPLAAGVVNELQRDGVDVTVDRHWTSLFGDQFDPTGRERAELWITGPAGTPPSPQATRLGVLSGASVWAGPLDPEKRP